MYTAKVLKGDYIVNNDIGVQIQLRLYLDGSVADLTTVTNATLLVQMNESPQDVRRFPLSISAPATAGLVTYTTQALDFDPTPGTPKMYPNVNARVELLFNDGSLIESYPFPMEIEAAWLT